MLPNVLAFQLVLRQTMQWRGEIGDRIPEARVVKVEVSLRARPTHFKVSGFITQRPTQGVWNRG